MMDYKGYKAQIDFDDEAGIFVGEVINTRDGITFTGKSVDELRQSLEKAVDDYLEMTTDVAIGADHPYSGMIAIRVTRAQHRAIASCAKRDGKSVAIWIADLLNEAIGTSVARAG